MKKFTKRFISGFGLIHFIGTALLAIILILMAVAVINHIGKPKDKALSKIVKEKPVVYSSGKLGDITKAANIVVKQLPSKYDYVGVYDEQNLIIANWYENPNGFSLYNINTNTITDFVKPIDGSYIMQVTYDNDWIVWMDIHQELPDGGDYIDIRKIVIKNRNTGKIKIINDIYFSFTYSNGILAYETRETTDKGERLSKLMIYKLKDNKKSELARYIIKDHGIEIAPPDIYNNKVVWMVHCYGWNAPDAGVFIYDINTKKLERLSKNKNIDWRYGACFASIYKDYVTVFGELVKNDKKQFLLYNLKTKQWMKVVSEDIEFWKDKISYFHGDLGGAVTPKFIYLPNLNGRLYIYDIKDDTVYDIYDLIKSDHDIEEYYVTLGKDIIIVRYDGGTVYINLSNMGGRKSQEVEKTQVGN